MTPEQREDIRQAVAYHRLKGGYADHNQSERFCRCAGCRLVRTVEDLEAAQDAVDVFWSEAGAFTVQVLKEERPDVIELAQDLHEARYHS